MSLLAQYEQQYAALIAEITAQIGRLQSVGGSERNELSAQIDASLNEAHELLEQMGLEIRELESLQRPIFISKLNCAQVELKRLQSEYCKAKEQQRLKQRSIFEMGDGHDNAAADDFYDDVAISNDQRQRLLDNSERLERTGNRLLDGYRVAIETEALGAQVLNDLHHQRETLQSARSRMHETNAELGRASRTLNSMMQRAMREKLVLAIVGVCFVLAVGLSLYLTFSEPAQQQS